MIGVAELTATEFCPNEIMTTLNTLAKIKPQEEIW